MGAPKDVDREFAMLFMLIDENASHYLQQNIDAHIQDPKSVNTLDMVPLDLEGNLDQAGQGFGTANFKASINGYIFGNLPGAPASRSSARASPMKLTRI